MVLGSLKRTQCELELEMLQISGTCIFGKELEVPCFKEPCRRRNHGRLFLPTTRLHRNRFSPPGFLQFGQASGTMSLSARGEVTKESVSGSCR